MSDTVYCGIKVSGEREQPCGVAFLGDDLETFSETDDERILELLEDRRPTIVAFSAPIQGGGRKPEGFTDDEQDLVDEGHTFLPREQHNTDEMERTLFLKNSIKRLGFMPEMLECRPRVTAQRLEAHDDAALEAYGIPTDGIRSTWEFDAVLAALTAKLYDNQMFAEKGFIVPELDEDDGDGADEQENGAARATGEEDDREAAQAGEEATEPVDPMDLLELDRDAEEDDG